MKYAAAAAALAGVATADWASWSSTTTSSTPEAATSTTSSSWTAWTTTSSYDPAAWGTGWTEATPAATSTTTSTASECSYVTEVPVTKCWGQGSEQCHVYSTKTTMYAETCTWSNWETPAATSTSSTWADWTTWVTPAASTTASCSYVEDIITLVCDEKKSDMCWYDEHKKTVYPTDCNAAPTWSTWETPVAATTASCSFTTAIPVTECWAENASVEACFSTTITHTVYPTDCVYWDEWQSTKTSPEAAQTWYSWPAEVSDVTETWVSWESTETVKATSTETQWQTVAVVTSDVKPEWSSNGWFGPAWPTSKNAQGCAVNVITSYGPAVWHPTPEATSTTSSSVSWVSYSPPAPVSASSTTSVTWATYSPPAPVAASSSSVSWVSYSPPAPVAVSSTISWVTYAAPTSAAPVSTWSPAPAAPAAGNGHAQIAPNGNKWSMAYSVYDASSNCKTKEVIYADIQKLAGLGFTSVKAYSTDCNTLEYVGGACEEYGLKIILGVYISSTGTSGAQSQVTDIQTWAKWEIVELIVVGNEAVQSGYCSASELVTFIASAKATFVAAGYTGPCTTTETLNIWQSSGSQFCSVVDVVAANLYAFFNSECEASGAGAFVQSEIDILETICPGKDTYVMESGWPSAGECNGAACPSPENQVVAIKSIEETCGAKIVFFSFENELWKQPGQWGVEQHWGCADVFASSSSGWGSAAVPAATSTATWNTWATPAATSTNTWASWSTTTTSAQADPTAWGKY